MIHDPKIKGQMFAFKRELYFSMQSDHFLVYYIFCWALQMTAGFLCISFVILQ